MANVPCHLDVNKLADNLTRQVRSIAQVTKSVAAGNLTRKIEVEADGEILELKITINSKFWASDLAIKKLFISFRNSHGGSTAYLCGRSNTGRAHGRY